MDALRSPLALLVPSGAKASDAASSSPGTRRYLTDGVLGALFAASHTVTESLPWVAASSGTVRFQLQAQPVPKICFGPPGQFDTTTVLGELTVS
jgi:hypothetical protein